MKQRLLVQLALIATIVLWASAFVGIRIGLNEYSPGPLALLRFIIASACMGVLYFFLPNRSHISLRDRLELSLIGLAGIGVYHICLNYGEMTVTAGIASFIIGLIPVFSVILSVLFLKERPTIGVWFGILISFIGLVLMMKSEGASSEISTGAYIVLIAAVMGAIHTVTQKRYLIRYHAIEVTSWILWGGTLSMFYFLPSLYLELPKISLTSTLAVCYLGVFPAAIAYLAWSYVLGNMSVSKASLYLYAMPIISTILGIIYLHEKPTLLSFIGGGVALLGAVIAHFYHTGEAKPIDKPSQAV